MKKIFILLLTYLIIDSFLLQVKAATWYVAQDGTGSGTSWIDASNDLQDMINASSDGDIILVKAGTYYTSKVTNFVSGFHPYTGSTDGNSYYNKYRTFFLKKGVKIYGGCDGTESIPSERTDIAGNITTLSGIIQGTSLSSATGHAYHVVIGLGDMTGTVLDGFSIQDGWGYVESNQNQKNGTSILTANDGSGNYTIQHLYGAGIYLDSNTNTSITLDNLVVQSNNATGETSFTSTSNGATYSSGGGIYSNRVSIDFGTLTVDRNSTIRDGGGIYLTGGATLTGNTLICSNNFSAFGNGAGVHINEADEVNILSINLTSNMISGAYGNGGGLYFTGNGASSTLIAETVTAAGNVIGLSGSGLFFNDVFTVRISEMLTLSNNQSISGTGVTSHGAGMYIYNSTVNGTSLTLKNAEITGNIFTNTGSNANYNKHGGGIYNYNVENFTATGTVTLKNNIAKDNGGGIYNYNVQTIEIEELICGAVGEGNAATNGSGGGMYNENTSVISIPVASATNNIAGINGGGIYNMNVININIPVLTLMNNTARSNAGMGGGLYISGTNSLSDFNTLQLVGNTVGTNSSTSATAMGGGMYLSGTYGITKLDVVNLTATGNVSWRDGGGIYTTGIDEINITNLTLDNNLASQTGSQANTSTSYFGNGGGIYAYSTVSNQVTLFQIENLLSCTGNSAQRYGGAFYNDNIGLFKIVNPIQNENVITNNIVKASDGGFIYNTNTVFEATNLIIGAGNKANINGGAIANVNNVSFIIDNYINIAGACTATTGNGGGIYNNSVTTFDVPVVTINACVAGSNGGGIYNNSVTTFDVPRLTVTNSTANTNGGGVYFISMNNLTDFELLSLSGNAATTATGGGLYMNGGWTNDIVVNDFLLQNNNAGTNGGGMYTTQVDNVYITNLTLDSNTAGNGGGGIYTSGTLSRYVNLIDIYKLVSCTNNKANGGSENGFGGAFFNQYLNTLRFETSVGFVMSNNEATFRGGGMYNNYVNTIAFPSQSTFTGNKTTNSSSSGGAVYNSNLPGFFADVLIMNANTSSGTGGAIYNTAITGDFIINDLTMNSNTATSSGGGMYFTTLTGEITFNKIAADGNTSGYQGGTFYFYNNNGNSINLSNAIISNSTSSDNGAGIFIKPQTTVCNFNLYNVELNSCKVTNNSKYGGGIYIESANSSTPTTGRAKLNANFTDVNLINCRAGYGGGMYAGYALNELTVTTAHFEYNKVEGNTTYNHGTGMYLTYLGGFAKIENTTFERNYGSGVPENTEGGGTDGTGGGLYTRQVTGSINNCKFIGNRVYNNGAGFYCAASNFTLSNLLFEDNYARAAGAGFYMDAGTSAVSATSFGEASQSIIFRNNQAGNGGGAVYATTGTLQLANTYFIGNTAGTNGGSIHADNENTYLYFYNTHFQGNRAADRGGCFYVGNRLGNFVFVNTLFAGNTATNGRGSVVYYSSTDCARGTYINCTFADNYANTSTLNAHFGCPVNVENNTSTNDTYYNCIFYNNRYQGGIRDNIMPGLSTSSPVTFTNCHFTSDDSYGPSLSFVNYTNITTGDPSFVNSLEAGVTGASTTGDYRLISGSTCIDAGNNALFLSEYNSRWSSIIGMLDLDMFDRIQNTAIDLGPYEDLGDRNRNMWYGTESTDWNIPNNWLDKMVPGNGEDIRFHPNAIRDLLVPAGGTEITTGNIYNSSPVNLVLNGEKLNVAGVMNFNVASSKIDARQTNSNLSLTGSGVDQTLVSELLISNSVYDLTIDRMDDVAVENSLRILNSLNIVNTGLLIADEATIFYGLGSEDYSTVNDERNYIPTTADEDKAAYAEYPVTDVEQIIVNGQYRNETIMNLVSDNSLGLKIETGQGAESILSVSNNLRVNNARKIIISADAGMEVKNMVYNEAGIDGIVIKTETGINSGTGRLAQTKPNGTFIFYNPDTYPVEGTVEFFSKAYYDPDGETGYKYKWQYFTVPVRSIVASPTFDASYLRQWNEFHDHTGGTPYWKPLTDTSILESLQGYEITQAMSKTFIIKGILENRNLNKYFTYTPYDPGQHVGWDEQKEFSGNQVMGNPYSAAIDIEAITFGSNLEQTVYVFNTGTYADWKNYNFDDNPTYGDAEGQYFSIPVNSAGSLGLDSKIPSMQGFVVKRTEENVSGETANTLTLNYSAVVTQNKTQLRSSEKVIKPIFTTIDMTSANSMDRLWILINENCSKGFDNGWDGRKFPSASAAAQLFTMEETSGKEEYFQISAMDDMNETYIGFKANQQDTEYTFTFNHTNTDLLDQRLYLTDLKEKKTMEITLSGSKYTFTADTKNSIEKRFKLSTENITSVEKPEVEESIYIYVENKEIVIENKGLVLANVSLYDLSGKHFLTRKVAPQTTVRINQNSLQGVYIIKISSEKTEFTKQVIL